MHNLFFAQPLQKMHGYMANKNTSKNNVLIAVYMYVTSVSG